MSINRVIISGNLTRDPELRSTQSGMDVLSFSVAVNDRRRNPQTNEWEDYPNFVDCTMFGNRARSLSQYLSKGTKVSIEGKLRWEQWERDGQKRSTLKVIVDELEFMSSRNQGASYGASQQQGYTYQAPPQNATPAPSYAPQQPNYGAQQQLPGYQPQQYAPAPPTAAQAVAAKPVIDASSSVYDDDIPF